MEENKELKIDTNLNDKLTNNKKKESSSEKKSKKPSQNKNQKSKLDNIKEKEQDDNVSKLLNIFNKLDKKDHKLVSKQDLKIGLIKIYPTIDLKEIDILILDGIKKMVKKKNLIKENKLYKLNKKN